MLFGRREFKYLFGSVHTQNYGRKIALGIITNKRKKKITKYSNCNTRKKKLDEIAEFINTNHLVVEENNEKADKSKESEKYC